MKDIRFDSIVSYCTALSNDPGEILHSIDRESHLKTVAPQMIAGPWMGKFLQFISLMIRPERVLEIGSFTGYSAICLSEGLQPGGSIHLVEANPEYARLIEDHLAKAGLSSSAVLHIGKAHDVVPGLDGPFDLAFIDAGKRDNLEHVELILPIIRKDGFILVDNILWGGKVLNPDQDEDTRAIHSFNEAMYADQRVEQCIIPLRDGVSVLRKL